MTSLMCGNLWRKNYGIPDMTIKKILFFALVALTVLISVCAFSFSYWLNHPTSQRTSQIQYYASEGKTFSQIARDLEGQKLISWPRLFIFYSRLVGLDRHVKLGTYAFDVQDTPKSILAKLSSGKTITIKVTIPEGLNQFQYAKKMAGYFPKITEEQWLDLIQSKELIALLQLDQPVENLEGFLYPETYFWDPNEKPSDILKNMILTFKSHITIEMIQKAKSMGLSQIEFVTFASIVEKETADPMERSKIAGVYWNRLKRHMRLQADPSVAYGAWGSHHTAITQKDLDAKNKYNTYVNYGLPQGPIASPGKTSFLAVLNPTKFDALYFVAKGDGSHVFAKTYKEHQRNVKRYLNFLKKSRNKNHEPLLRNARNTHF